MQSGPVERVVIVGAGLAGLRTAEELRSLGYAGELTIIGAEAHPPYSRPPLSKEVLRGEAGPETAHLRTPEALDGLGLDLRLGRRGTALDPERHEITLDDGTALGYDRVVIATGATPRALPGVEGSHVHVLRTI